MQSSSSSAPALVPVSLWEITRYFLWLGTVGFGGPLALVNSMDEDLVRRRRWLSEQEYLEGLAIANTLPGPVAFQVGVYCGYARHGILGGVLTGLAFIAFSVLLLLLGGALYLRYAALDTVTALFYGIGPVMVAIVLQSGYKLTRRTIKDPLQWALFAVSLAITVVTQRELALLFVAAGLIGLGWYAKPWRRALRKPARCAPDAPVGPGAGGGPLAVLLTAGLLPAVSSGALAQLFWFFFEAGLFVFGSGLVIVPLLKAGLVDQHHWLSERAFVDAVAMGIVTPGPVVIMATFAGYLVAGLGGAAVATVGIFLPSYLMVFLGAPLMRRYRDVPEVQGFVRGITAAVIGVIFGTTWMLARATVGDWFTAVLGLVALGLLLRTRVLPVWIVLGAALLGLLVFPYTQPGWVIR
jgi:chromate transporter